MCQLVEDSETPIWFVTSLIIHGVELDVKNISLHPSGNDKLGYVEKLEKTLHEMTGCPARCIDWLKRSRAGVCLPEHTHVLQIEPAFANSKI